MMRFRYRLEALLKQRRWERDASTLQERTARQVLQAQVDEARRAREALEAVEHALRDAYRAGASIDPRQHEAALLYLGRAREALRAKAGQAAGAREVHERTRESLLRAVQAVRGLEQHRGNRSREHARERQGQEQQKQDDLWLTRRRSTWR